MTTKQADDDATGKPHKKDDTLPDQRRDQRRDPNGDPQQDYEHGRDPKNDPEYGQKHDPNRLPSSALSPQEKHDRDIEDLKKAGHDFKGPEVPKNENSNPDDPQLRNVEVETQRTRRDDGLEVPPVPGSNVDPATRREYDPSRAPWGNEPAAHPHRTKE